MNSCSVSAKCQALYKNYLHSTASHHCHCASPNHYYYQDGWTISVSYKPGLLGLKLVLYIGCLWLHDKLPQI